MSTYTVTLDKQEFNIEVISPKTIIVNGTEISVELLENNKTFLLRCSEKRHRIFCKKFSTSQYEIWIKNHVLTITIEDLKSKLLKQFTISKPTGYEAYAVKAPMPGLVAVIEVTIGDEVQVGTGLIVLEAMKMENEIRSTVNGRIKSINVEKRATVEKGQVLLNIEPLTVAPI